MSDTIAALMWVAVTGYVILGGADFGAGVWDLLAGKGERAIRVRKLIDEAITPVWEANHVWVIFALVLCWTAFGSAFSSILSTLWIPFALALLGIVVRGSGFAFRHAVSGRSHDVAGRLFAVASLLTPFFLGAALGGIASGRVPIGNAAGDPLTSWVNASSIVVGVLAVVSCAYLAAVFLVADAIRLGEEELREYFARRATITAAVAGAIAVAGIVVLRSDAPYVGDRLTGAALPLILVSVAAGAVNLVLLRGGRSRWTRPAAVLAVAAVVWGWGVAQYPYLLPTSLKISAGAAGDATLQWLLAVGVAAVLTVGPALALLFRLDRSTMLGEERAKAPR